MATLSHCIYLFIFVQFFPKCLSDGASEWYSNIKRDSFRTYFNASENWDENNLVHDTVTGNENTPSRYIPAWASLDSRPLPIWYDQSKIGIFIHWGVFSVPGIGDAWFWKHWKDGDAEETSFMKKNYKPGFTYQDFAEEFTADFFDPVKWTNLFQKAGARYIVMVTKHHDGYTLWPSKYSFSWNAEDVGPHRDLVGDLAFAVRNNTKLKLGLYRSLYEWFNPLYMSDAKNNFSSDEFIRFKTLPELYELVESYKPEVIWSDGDWSAPDTYWKSQDFLAWLYNDSPVKDTVVTNDRWGQGVTCKHGGYYTCQDRYNPGVLQPHKWENCFTLDKKSWGFRRNAQLEDYLTPEELITTIVETVSCGGNALVNVGPTKDGMIPIIQEERLLQMGEWLEINGEAIYDTIPYIAQNDSLTSGVWYTMSPDAERVYAMITKWPGSSITLASVLVKDSTQISILGDPPSKLTWKRVTEGIFVSLPSLENIKSKWTRTLVITNS